MEFHDLICPVCGEPLSKEGDLYRCKYCAHVFEATHHDEAIDVLSRLLEADKIERLANARRLLYDATHHERKIVEFPVQEAVVNAARAVLAIRQEEPFALIVLHSYDADPYALVQTLSSLSVDSQLAGDIFSWLLMMLSPRLLGPLNDFVCRHFKDRERTQKLAALEEEAAKIDDGTYVHTLTRDVFLAYSSSDMAEVLKIMDLLEENGLTVFAAFRNMRHGKGAAENYLNLLKEAMGACKTFVFLSSNSSRQMTCDAMKVELPYLISSLPGKKRVEYVLHDYPARLPLMVRNTLKDAFPEQEQCRDEEELVARVYNLISQKEEPKQEKKEPLIEVNRQEDESKAHQAELERLRKEMELAQKEEIERLRKEIEKAKKAAEAPLPAKAEAPVKTSVETLKPASPIPSSPKVAPAIAPKEAQEPKQDATLNYDPAEFSIHHGKTLSKYKGHEKKVVVPDFITEIGDYAFSSRTSIVEIVLPPSLESIGKSAFNECRDLVKINIPPSVKSIGQWAFYRCRSLKEIVLPPCLESIGDCFFAECASLQQVALPPAITSIGARAFAQCSCLQEVVIPPSVTSIGRSAFAECKSLTRLDIPSSVTSIDGWAFHKCTSLSSVSFLASVPSIDEYLFSECASLKEITLPATVKSIGRFAFNRCTSLLNVSLIEGLTSIGAYAFSNCVAIKELAIPSSVAKIDMSAFAKCTCTLRIPAATKMKNGRFRYPEGYGKLFLDSFAGKVSAE